MTFKPTELPSFTGVPNDAPRLIRREVKLETARKAVLGLAAAQILKVKPAGMQRPKNEEPWEAEKLLLVSAYGASDYLDLTPDKIPYRRVMSLEECKRFEPGTVKYYVCLLPMRGLMRVLGDTPIACEHLARGKSFDSVDEAMQEFEK